LSPKITANPIATSDKWTVLLGGGVSKVVSISELPLKLEVAAYYNAIRLPRAKIPGSYRHAGFCLFSPTKAASSQ
jgi:hypothetical protein